MSKLKILKDIMKFEPSSQELNSMNNHAHGSYICHYELKQEAIKWVKEFERRQIFLSDWLNFFNITEEDLK